MMKGINPWQQLTPMQEGAQFLPDTPIWEAYPEVARAIPGNPFLANELAKRYGPGVRNMSGFASEIGLGNERILIKPHDGPVGEHKDDLGVSYPDQNKIQFDRLQPQDTQRATIAHELAHIADNIKDPTFQPSKEESTDSQHHENFQFFEPEMALSMAAQRALENGLPVNKAILNQYPWLKNVAPLSSNPLANPWRGARGE